MEKKKAKEMAETGQQSGTDQEKTTEKEEKKEEEKQEKVEEKPEPEPEPSKLVNFTHFICIPLDDLSSFEKKLKTFYGKIKEIDPDLEHFFHQKLPHFTLIMLHIEPEQEEVYKMILAEMQPKLKKIARQDIVIKKKCYKFDLQGIDFFGDKGKHPAQARVLFAEIKDETVVDKFNQYTDCLMKNLVSMQMVDPSAQRNVTFDSNKQ